MKVTMGWVRNIRKNAQSMFVREMCMVSLNGPWLRAIHKLCDEVIALESRDIEYRARLKARRRWNDTAYRRNRTLIRELRDVRAKCAVYKEGVNIQRWWKDLSYKRNRELLEELRDVRALNASLRKELTCRQVQRAQILSILLGPIDGR